MVSKSKECLLPYYPNRKLLYAFNTARGSKHLEFPTTEEADCGLEVRKAEFLGATRPLGELVTGMNRKASLYGEFHWNYPTGQHLLYDF